MKAQGIISDILMVLRTGRQNYTFHELLGGVNKYAAMGPGDVTYCALRNALRLLIETGEVLVFPTGAPLDDARITHCAFEPAVKAEAAK